MKVLVTGAAGFIGFHVSAALLNRGHEVVGFDNLSDYYDINLKKARLSQLEPIAGFAFVKGDLANQRDVDAVFAAHEPQRVIHLAAQAGVRHSLSHPHDYAQSNLVGFLSILEACRHNQVDHLVFASSSSVYGANTRIPFTVHDNVDHPVSLYAASKKSNELMAHTYAHLFNLPVTGLRFFTVYGPWGRPDMALFMFTKSVLAGEPINIFNEGNNSRDFTYIDDVVDCVLRVADRIPQPNPRWHNETPDAATSSAPYRIYNIGNQSPVDLMDFVACIENATGRTAKKNFLPAQPGDVQATYADVSDLQADLGWAPNTPIDKGVAEFVAWYRDHYSV